MFIHVPIPCKGKGTNLQSRAAQVHSALFPRGAVLVLRVSKSGVVSALSKVPATSMVLVCSCSFPPVRRFSANLIILSCFLFESGFSEDHAPKTIYKQKLSLHLYTPSIFFRTFQFHIIFWTHFLTSSVAKSTQQSEQKVIIKVSPSHVQYPVGSL